MEHQILAATGPLPKVLKYPRRNSCLLMISSNGHTCYVLWEKNGLSKSPRENIEGDLKAWPNACNISTQHLATLLHDVATCVEWTGQTHAIYCNRVAKRTQHVEPNNVARCFVEMLRAFGKALSI